MPLTPPRKLFSVEFFADLVKYHDEVSSKLAPLGDYESAAATVYSNLASRKSSDAALVSACQEDVIETVYVMTKLIESKIIPTSWDKMSTQDWMYSLSKQIWAMNAKKGEFGPVRFKDESEENLQKRRSLGAKNALAQIENAEIPLVSSCYEFMETLQNVNKDNVFKVLSVPFMVFKGSPGMGCVMVVDRLALIAKAQTKRLEKIQSRLDSLYNKLYHISQTT